MMYRRLSWAMMTTTVLPRLFLRNQHFSHCTFLFDYSARVYYVVECGVCGCEVLFRTVFKVIISDGCKEVCKRADRDAGCCMGCDTDCPGCTADVDAGDVESHAGNDGSNGVACDIGIGMAMDEEEPLPFGCIRPPNIPPMSPPV